MNNPPGRKEIKQSGTADWVQSALNEHQRQQDALADVFGAAADQLEREREGVADVWKAPAETPAERGPDLFAAERARGDQQRKQLSSVWEQDRAAKAAEDESLRNLFGKPKR